MTKQEFEERYGKIVNDHVFYNINELYMSLDDMDKDMFVKDYKEHEESLILNDLFNKKQDLERELKKVKAMYDLAMDKLISKGAEWDDSEALDFAETQVGKKEVIRRKITLDTELSDDDLEYIKHNLR